MGILYITRHGETEYNRRGIWTGQKNIGLNKTGMAQSQKLAKEIKNLDIDFILASSLARSRQTAEIVNYHIRKPIKIDPRLMERNVGVYEGLAREERKKRLVRSKNDAAVRYNETPPDGESANDVEKRVFAAMGDLTTRYPDKKILVVTHSFIGKMINKYFNPAITTEEFFNFNLPNAEIKRFEF